MTSSRRRKWSALSALAVLVLGGGLVLWGPWESRGTAPIRIMDPIEANNLHVPLAAARGYFSAEGLDVEVSGTAAGKFAMDALNGGAVDYAVVVDVNVAQTLFSHDDVVILGELAEPVGAIKVIGRRTRGVERPSDLRGKRIAVLFGVNVHIFLLRYLGTLGIPEEDVTLVNLTPPNGVAAFKSGDVDALITWQPHIYKLQQELGDDVVVLTDDSSLWTYKMLLVTSRSRYDERPDEAAAILRAVLKADDHIKADPDDAIQVLSDRVNLSSEAIMSFWSEIQFKVQMSPKLLSMLAYELKWLSSRFHDGRSPVTSDVRSILAPDLARLRPEAWQLGQ